MTKINIREILERHEYLARVQTDSMPDLRQATINAIKEIVEATVDLCAREASIKTNFYSDEDYSRQELMDLRDSALISSERTDGDGMLYAVDTYEINQQSILNVKNLVEYE